MTTLLLVHGGWSTSAVWDAFTPELDARGVAWRVLDLPGHGSQRRRSFWSVSLRDYAAAVAAEAEAVEGPVVAVGHSMGGMVISQAAAWAPEHFATLVYLAAFLPRDGERLIALAGRDKGSQFAGAFGLDFLRGRIALHRERAEPLLFHDCPDEDASPVVASLQPNPMRPALTRLRLDGRFDDVPKHYIQCTADRAISPAHQEWMAARYALASFQQMDTGHMPMLAEPEELAARLEAIASG